MCGITGFVDHQKSISEKDLLNASNTLRHRGGNGYGHIYESKEKFNFGLANERLATIDPSIDSLQPFTSSCGNYTITFNGTIYNYIELRAILIKYGIIFKSLSDTEVLLECYKKWGVQLFEKIDGAFAFAIIDRKKNQLFIARDTFGVKPLYFYKDKHLFAFASELKGILQYPIEKKININTLENFLRHGYCYGDETIYQNIWNFKKQHFFIIDLNSGNLLEDKFEDSSPYLADSFDSEIKLTEKIHDLLAASILRRNVADVNIGVMLNGGYSSATIAAILQKNQVKKLRTFTLGFKDKKLNAAPAAIAIAKHLNTKHTEYYIDKAGAINMIDKMPEIFDEPTGDSSTIPLAYLIQEIAKEDIKVLLGAEGGDELFAGHQNYKKAIWLNKQVKQLPDLFKKIAIGFSKTRKSKLQELLYTENLINTYESLKSPYSINDLEKLLNKELKRPIYTDLTADVKSLLNLDIENLSNSLLLKSDRIAMHYGIDNRDALLKTDLVSLLKSVDKKWFVKNGSLKYLLKNIAHQYIPKELMSNSEKCLNIPLTQWMKSIYKPYLDEYLSPDQLNKHQFFDIVEVFKTKNSFFSNPNERDAKKLWLLLQFQMWYLKNFEKN